MALIGSLTSGVSALKSFTKGIEVIGNNIANVNTTGFKSANIRYQDNFSNVLSQASGNDGTAPATVQVGTGSNVSQIKSLFSQGAVSSTGIYTDLAINGEGYFVVRDTASGTDYATRAGDFSVDDSGNLVTPNGLNVRGLTGGAISYVVTEVGGQLVFTPTKTEPATVGNINFDFSLGVGSGLTVDASVTSFTNAQIEAAAPQLSSIAFDKFGNASFYLSNGDSFNKGQVLLTSFKNQDALTKEGSNLYSNLSAAGPLGGSVGLSAGNNTPGTNGLGSFKTSAIELSNVDLTQEFADLITTQRSFQAASRIITVSDDILQEVVNLKR